jgi:hypothetical protein
VYLLGSFDGALRDHDRVSLVAQVDTLTPVSDMPHRVHEGDAGPSRVLHPRPAKTVQVELAAWEPEGVERLQQTAAQRTVRQRALLVALRAEQEA